MSGSFENFSVNQVDDFFGVNNFTGRIRVSPSNGQINLLSDDMTIHWPSHFKNEVLINKEEYTFLKCITRYVRITYIRLAATYYIKVIKLAEELLFMCLKNI